MIQLNQIKLIDTISKLIINFLLFKVKHCCIFSIIQSSSPNKSTPFVLHMCKTKMAINASQPLPKTTANKAPPTSSSSSSFNPSSPSISSSSSSTYTLNTSTSSQTSLSSLRHSLPENTHIYNFSDIRFATNNFLSKPFSSSSSQSWLVMLNNKDSIIFQRKSRKPIETNELKSKLTLLCRSHQKGIIKLLGASISNNYIYLVYEHAKGSSNLLTCLRNPKNMNFTVLSTWMSRMQIATDVAHALEYIHYHTGFSFSLVHKHVKTSGIVVTEPDFHAKICHFGAAELCGETAEEGGEGRRTAEFEGVRGYMSPEFQETGEATQKSDVYAFGVVLLEILCGEEPLRYKVDKATGNYRKISIIESARMAVEGGGDGGVEGGLRRWVDRRLRDSFPVEVVEKLTRVALDCVRVEADDRPNMRRVSGKISKLYLDSKIWSSRVMVPDEISVSLAPR